MVQNDYTIDDIQDGMPDSVFVWKKIQAETEKTWYTTLMTAVNHFAELHDNKGMQIRGKAILSGKDPEQDEEQIQEYALK